MIRLNITLPEEVVRELNHVKNKSRFIAQAIRVQFELEKRKHLEIQMIEGYKACAAEDRPVSAEWESATADGLDG